MTPFRGILTAMVTPFRDDGALDLVGARRLASHLIENGSHGVVVAGTTGEAPTLTDDEKLELLEAVLDEIGENATVVCGTGSNDTRHTADLTRRAAAAGAHAVLVVTPYYNKPTEAGLRAHFAEASAAAGDTPICLYNIPSRSVVNMPPELLASLAEQHRNILGVKQANNADMGAVEGLDVLAGNDDIFTRCLREGGTGGILVASHVVGPELRALFDAASEGDHERALELDRELADVYAALSLAPPASTVKAVLAMRGIIGETQRLPMVPVDGPGREALAELA
jgi:4-hydroxy-tetrahydrodipicolinate synthase